MTAVPVVPVAHSNSNSNSNSNPTIGVLYDRWTVPIIVPGCVKGRSVHLVDDKGDPIPNPYTVYLVPLVEQGQLLLADWRGPTRRQKAYFSIQTPELPFNGEPLNDFFQFWYRAMTILEFNFLMSNRAVQDVSQVGIGTRYHYIYNPANKKNKYYPTGNYRVIVRFDLGHPNDPNRVDLMAEIESRPGWNKKDDGKYAIGLGTASANEGALLWFNKQIALGKIKYEPIRFWVECLLTGTDAENEWNQLDNLQPMEPIPYKQYIKSVHEFGNLASEYLANLAGVWATRGKGGFTPEMEEVVAKSQSQKAHQEYVDYDFGIDYNDYIKSEIVPIGYNDYDFRNGYSNDYSSNINMIVSVLSVFILCGMTCCICFVCGCIVGYFAPISSKQCDFKDENDS